MSPWLAIPAIFGFFWWAEHESPKWAARSFVATVRGKYRNPMSDYERGCS